MRKDVNDYIANLGLEKMEWHEDGELPEYALIISDFGDQLSLDFGQSFADDWMTADDLSFCGPVKMVVAFAEVKI